MKKSIHDEIAKVAFELYEKEGGVHGNDLKNWFEAENIVMEKHERHARLIESRVNLSINPHRDIGVPLKKKGSTRKVERRS